MVSNIVLVTVLAGYGIIGEARVDSIEACTAMREAVTAQSNIQAYCTYSDAPTNPLEALELMRKWVERVEDLPEFGEPELVDPLEGMDWRTM